MKKLFTLLMMLIVAVTSSWAIDVTDTFSSVIETNSGANIGIAKLAKSGEVTVSSSSFQVGTGKTGGFTVTTPDGFAIKTIQFEEKSNGKVSGLTCSDGGTDKISTSSKVTTYTSTSTINEVTFTWSGSGGNAQIYKIVVTMTNNDIAAGDYEYITPDGSVSDDAIPFKSSLGDNKVLSSLTQYGGATCSKPEIAFGNGKGFTIAAGRAIKAVYFTWTKRSPENDSDWGGYVPNSTTAVGDATGSHSKTANCWTATGKETTSVTFRRNTGNEARVAGFHVIYYPAGPTINEHPQSAAYASGDPIAALTVDATASAGELSYQWYSCDDTDKTNAAAIDGETSASYTPTGAGFYYVNVTDDNGDVDSNVAQITVSAAEAPTISVDGAPAGDIVTGTEVTLTATMTGVPTPTIQWYSNSAASTTGGTLIPSATEETYSPSTDTPGTYYYYAVATNSVNDATSALQTLVVKDQVATPTFNPNGGFFQESQEVTIACTTSGATIQYSTNGGETWADYTEAFTLTATTTVQAKAIKDGCIDSEVASATFTKVTLDPQVDVTASATWDWTKYGTKEIKLTETTTPKKTDEFVFSNISKYGYAAPAADFGNAQQLLVTTEYVVRDYDGKGKGFLQGGHIKFNTTVPGTLSVTYANTGSRTAEGDRRFLNVNGINYGVGTMNYDWVTTENIVVAAGEVHIKGILKGDGTDQYLRIKEIVFTASEAPATESVTTNSAGWASFTPLVNETLPEGAKAYIVTAVNNSGASVTATEITTLKGGVGYFIKGTANTAYTMTKTTAEATATTGNMLVGCLNDITLGAGVTPYRYFLGTKNETAGLYYVDETAVTIPAGKCYLQSAITADPQDLTIDFDDAPTAVETVQEAKVNVPVPVKVIKNGQLFIGNYNVAGARVK